MNNSWSKSVFPIAAIFSFRMLGLFMLIPVFTLYAPDLTGATPTLIGIALGSYGLSQGLLQIPFGLLSDYFGRKPLIIIGLLFFIGGSLLGAVTHSIYGMILARILQGSGAIGSVLIALMADLTPDNQRTKAMAVIGATIGLSFSLAMILSPFIARYFGLSGIFYVTAGLATMGLLLTQLVIPTPQREHRYLLNEAKSSLIRSVVFNKELQRLNLGIFIQHLTLTTTFFVTPLLLREQIEQHNLTQQWHFYLPLMLVSFLIMMPFIVMGERKNKMRGMFLFSILLIAASQLFLSIFYHHWLAFSTLMLCYFVAFNILEASLPALISRKAPSKSKGTAMGIYSSAQFLGIFAGGLTAGLLYQYTSVQTLFLVNGLLGILWFATAFPMTPPTLTKI